MSPYNIAILAGIIPLLGLLLKIRKDRRDRDYDDDLEPGPARPSRRSGQDDTGPSGPLAAGSSWVVGSGGAGAGGSLGGSSPAYEIAYPWAVADAADDGTAPSAGAPDQAAPSADSWFASPPADEPHPQDAPDGADAAAATTGSWEIAPELAADPPAAAGEQPGRPDEPEWLSPPPSADASAIADDGAPDWTAWADATAEPIAAHDESPPEVPAPAAAAGSVEPDADAPDIAWERWDAWDADSAVPAAEPAGHLAAAEVAATLLADPPRNGNGGHPDATSGPGPHPFFAPVPEWPPPARADGDAGAGWAAVAGRFSGGQEASGGDANDPPEPVAWWDMDVPEPEPEGPGDADWRRGHFALGGHALFPGQPAIGGVTFRRTLERPPAADGGAGGVSLSVEAALNCDPDSVAVVADEGFGPTAEGFTLRADAREVGLFMVSGTYELRDS